MAIPRPRPASDMPEVRDLCQKLAPGSVPYRVTVLDPPPWAEPDECTENVNRVVNELGGRTELGWQLWETLPGVMIEAEFHAVWINEDGERADVTPKQVPDLETITFLPDPELVYEGRQIDNVRVPLVEDQLVDDFIAAHKSLFEALNRGDLADYHGPIELTNEMRILMRRINGLKGKLVEKYYSD